MPDPLIKIDLNTRPLLDVFARISAGMSGTQALMRNVAEIMMFEVSENFAQQGRPRWADLRHASLERAGYKVSRKTGRYTIGKGKAAGYMILQQSRRLAESITPSFDARSATVGTNVVYAAIHQFGGKTRPHVIRAKNAKALALGGGRFAKSVNHPGSNIPARPFLTLSAAGEQKIVRAGEAFLRGVIGG